MYLDPYYFPPNMYFWFDILRRFAGDVGAAGELM